MESIDSSKTHFYLKGFDYMKNNNKMDAMNCIGTLERAEARLMLIILKKAMTSTK